MPSFTRWRMTLRSISAKAAWICRKARPMGVVVSIGVQCAEADAAALQLIHQPDQLAGEPPEAVEVEHDQHVALAQVVQARLETRPVGVGPATAVVEDAVAPGGPEAGGSGEETTVRSALRGSRHPIRRPCA